MINYQAQFYNIYYKIESEVSEDDYKFEIYNDSDLNN